MYRLFFFPTFLAQEQLVRGNAMEEKQTFVTTLLACNSCRVKLVKKSIVVFVSSQ